MSRCKNSRFLERTLLAVLNWSGAGGKMVWILSEKVLGTTPLWSSVRSLESQARCRRVVRAAPVASAPHGRDALDHRLNARIDPSDVIQEAYLDAAALRVADYEPDPKFPVFLWLRLIVGERLLKVHRHHLGTHMRDASREISLYRGPLPAASSMAIAAQLLGRHTSPTQAAVRAERLVRLQDALNALEPIDREILSLRHFEELTHSEAARASTSRNRRPRNDTFAP